MIQGPEHLMLFSFLGRILGKALYEGLTVEPKFAHFFLSYLKACPLFSPPFHAAWQPMSLAMSPAIRRCVTVCDWA